MDGKIVGMRDPEDLVEYAEQAVDERCDALLDPAFPYGEDLLQSLWEAGLYDATDLRTTDGRALEVVQAGRVQHNSGPDLRDALVRIGGQLWAGTVEVHLRASQWNSHGHQHDPAYDNVVLHAVHTHDADVRTACGAVPPTVELRQRLDPRQIELHLELMNGQGWVPCAARIGQVQPARIGPWLDRLLVERLERRTLETETLYRQLGNDPSETFHHLLLRALGAPVNAEAFAMLAHALPLRILLKHRTDPVRVLGLLLGQAGLLEKAGTGPLAQRMAAEYAALAKLHGLAPMPAAAWKFGRMRPASFPSARLAQLAGLIARTGPAYGELLVTDDARDLRRAIRGDAAGRTGSPPSTKDDAPPRPARIGPGAADGIILNAVVPFLFAMGRLQGEGRLADRALRLLEQLPAEANTITAGWKALGVAMPDAGRGQSLIELKTRWCNERKCLSCAIGSHLRKQLAMPGAADKP